MKILIAPLNWGLGHATRCIPLIHQYLSAGEEVVLGGDGESIALLRRTFPTLRVIDLPSLELRYAKNTKQRGFYMRAIPALICFTIADHCYLRQLLAMEHFDMVLSDNRFGLYTRQTHCVYMTHQLYVRLPKRLQFFQPLARMLHEYFYKKYDEVWVPDYSSPTNNLAGALAHGGEFDNRAVYIGPLSRFVSHAISEATHHETYQIVAILSGLEPQRTIFEQELIKRFSETDISVLIVQGKINNPMRKTQIGTITIVPYLSDNELQTHMLHAEKIIARSGYSTIMDLATLGLLSKAELHPTAGQSEQEYLSQIHQASHHTSCTTM